MARTRDYGHFCVIARSLEVIGEKWSLLVVRDLLRGPQRFTDLLRYMGGITPKWLSARLRDLEAEGIIERDSVEGRREVWYRLTEKGRDLAPVLEALAVWGIDHALRPPLPGEPVYPDLVLQAASLYMNRRGIRGPAAAVAWQFRFEERPPVALVFDGERWSARPGEAPDAELTITTTPEALVEFLNARGAARERLARALAIDGPASAQRAFRDVMVPARSGTAPA